MKKIFTIALLFSATILVAQSKRSNPSQTLRFDNQTSINPNYTINNSRAIGDTVFFFDGSTFSWTTGTADAATFDSQTADNDGLTPNAAIAGGFSSTNGAFTFYYGLDTVSTNPLQVDSFFYMGCYSWFTVSGPAGKADDWFTFGPINVPASGAKIKWGHSMPDGTFRDGYRVLVNSSSLFPDDFTQVIFDVNDNDPSTVNDTVFWATREAWLPFQYNGQEIYIGFNHDATDQFELYLDDIAIVEEENLGFAENVNARFVALYPNPTNSLTNVSYSLAKNSTVSVSLVDVTGKVVYTATEGNKAAGNNKLQVETSALSNGAYFINLNVDGKTISQKLTVIH
jgi:hypothetical protein